MYLNKVFIIGNLTRDPELKSLPSGTQVTNMSLATNSVYNDKEGNRQENTEYHNIVIFGRQAETTAQYLKKGSSALVEGRMQTRSWEGQDGKKNYRTEIIADRVQFGARSGGGGAPQQNESGPGSSNSDNNQSKDKTPEYPEEEINPEDIPF
jgi:single-strand DNA-binding protein